jgi:lipid II:glycine glycyltransferase (peptidoglycan interpeptide bridge formation enzyme)
LHKNISLALASHVKTEYRSVRCRMSPEMLDLQPFAWTGYSIFVDYTYRASLADLEETWMGMEDKKRNDIRKAEREGIVVDQTATLTDILALEEMTLQRKGKIIDFGEAELRREAALRASHQCRSFVAKSKEGAALAGVYLVWDEKCAYYLIGGHSSSSAHRGAASLAIWEAMRYAGTTLALKKFDFAGGNMRMLERFFRDFGGSLTPRYEIVFEQPSLRRDLKRIGDRVKRVLKLG